MRYTESMRYLIGNWKSNKTFEETYTWFDEFSKVYSPVSDLSVVVAVPFLYIQEGQKKLAELSLQKVSLASQDVSPYPFGSYTGAVSAQMLKGHVSYAIVGHSERREHFGESHLEIASKIDQLLEVGITPVLCIDEPYAQKQFATIDESKIEKLVIAYEPLEAIGTGQPAEPDHVATVVKKIRAIINNESVPIIYGGSTNAENARTFLKVEGISGLLPGGSSLKPDVFAQMAQAYF